MACRVDEVGALMREVRALRVAVGAEGAALYRGWRPRLRVPGAAASQLNLAHYLALRHRELRPLQDRLAVLGLSSLGRAEGHVAASLDAVAAALAGLAGERFRLVPVRRFERGPARLRANTERLFGPAAGARETRIMVTLPTEAAADPGHTLELVRRGAELVRINCAHDEARAWVAMASHAREAGRACGRAVRVLMDIAGPKLRTGAVAHPKGRKHVEVGDRLRLAADAAVVARARREFAAELAVEAESGGEVLRRLQAGARVSIDDGQLDAVVREPLADGGVMLETLRAPEGGYRLKPDKGVNLPGTELGLAPLSAKDLAALEVIAAHADLVGHSFVNRASDVAALQAALADRRAGRQAGRAMGVIAKVETVAAVRNLPEIIAQGAGSQPFGVMIARGDLAVEIGFQRVAEMQEEVLWMCEAAQVPVIWATQVLESMVKSGLPTRGEMTDAAMAGRAECVMLNKGQQVGDAVALLDALLVRMAAHQRKKTPTLRALTSW